jgi:hypothetical protein
LSGEWGGSGAILSLAFDGESCSHDGDDVIDVVGLLECHKDVGEQRTKDGSGWTNR